jgi:lipoate-protein ligase A
VRRPTGGRGIFHANEVTYSIVAPIDHPAVSGGIVESYRRISLALAAGLRAMGVDVAADQKRSDISRDLLAAANCFTAPSHYEITVDGRKLVGSAQTRSAGWLLQHGSILLGIDATAWNTVMPSPAGRGVALGDLMIAMDEIFGAPPGADEVRDAVIAAMESTFAIDLVPGEAGAALLAAAEALAREKYAADTWTLRR